MEAIIIIGDSNNGESYMLEKVAIFWIIAFFVVFMASAFHWVYKTYFKK